MRRRNGAMAPRRTGTAFVLLTLLLTAVAAAQLAQVRPIFRLPLPLADISVAPDTVSGVSVIMLPSDASKQKRDGYVWLRFEPDSALEWINSAVAAISTPVTSAQSEGIQWSRTLLPGDGRGGMSLGRSRKKGSLQKTHWLAIADSVTGWRFELTGAEADSLLRLLLRAATQSRLDTLDSAPRDQSRTDVPARVDHQPRLAARGRGGRVLAQWVVGVDGRMEPGSFVAFLASDPALTAEALESVERSRFRPAERGGRPVRQLMVRLFSW